MNGRLLTTRKVAEYVALSPETVLRRLPGLALPAFVAAYGGIGRERLQPVAVEAPFPAGTPLVSLFGHGENAEVHAGMLLDTAAAAVFSDLRLGSWRECCDTDRAISNPRFLATHQSCRDQGSPNRDYDCHYDSDPAPRHDGLQHKSARRDLGRARRQEGS
jgi:hypothetical protein